MKKILFGIIFLLSFGVVHADGCDALLTREAAQFIKDIVTIVRIAVPILLIVLCSSDFVSIVTGQDENITKKAISRIIKRFICAAAFFFVPLILQLILGIDAVNNALNLVDDPTCGIDGDLDGYKSEEEIQEEIEKELEEERKKKEEEEKKKKIGEISKNGVIVNVEITIKDNIQGYYFSFDDEDPDSKTPYLATTQKKLEVIRLAGTTYVWVKTEKGEVRGPIKVEISNSDIQRTMNKGTILKGTSLKTYIEKKGGSLEELNKLIARSVRAAGLYTKEGAATAAIALQLGLMQKYNVKIPYMMGGKNHIYGAGSYFGTYYDNKTYPQHTYRGFDCGGFVNWSYFNTGIESSNFQIKTYFFYWEGLPYKESNGEVGDILRTFANSQHIEHVAIIVGKTDTSFIVAEAYGLGQGVIIRDYPYDDAMAKRDYTIIKGDRLEKEYTKVSNSTYPSGF